MLLIFFPSIAYYPPLPFLMYPVCLYMQFALDDSSCTVLLGHTRVMAVISASLEAPYPDRPSEGSLRFNVEFSPMASPAFETGRPGEDAVELARLVERGLKESRAVDLEALCVQAGRRVWHLRADVHVLDHCGNLADACGLAALGTLCAFRRPDVTVNAGDALNAVVVHSTDEKEPVALTIHHLPLPVTFALFEEGELLALDPSLKEEAAASGGFTVTLNPAGELCAVQKVRGVGMSPSQIMRCMRLAHRKVTELTEQLRKALDAHEIARVQSRIRRKPGAGAPAVLGTIQPTSAAAPMDIEIEALPADVQRAVDKANAQDTSSSDESQGVVAGEDNEQEQSGLEGQQQQQEEEEEERDAMQGIEEAPRPVGDASISEGAAGDGTAERKRKKRRRKSQGGDGSDAFAAVSEMIAGSKKGEAGDLKAAIKRKSNASKKT